MHRWTREAVRWVFCVLACVSMTSELAKAQMPPEVVDLRIVKIGQSTMITWDPQPGMVYDVIRGRMSDLIDQTLPGATVCLANDVPGPPGPPYSEPLFVECVDDVLRSCWYVVRAQDPLGVVGSYGSPIFDSDFLFGLCPEGPATPTGRGSFFSVSRNLPLSTASAFLLTDADNGLEIMPNFDSSMQAAPWIMLTDIATGLHVYKVAESLNAETSTDTSLGADGFPDILMEDGHNRRTDPAAGLDGFGTCLGTAGDPGASKNNFAQCNFRDIGQLQNTTDLATGRINDDGLDDVVLVGRNRSVPDAIWINSGSDTCTPSLGPGGYDEDDGIPCFNEKVDLPAFGLQVERVSLAHTESSMVGGPVNLIARLGGSLPVGQNQALGGLRIYQNLCAYSGACSTASFVDVTSLVIPGPLPILANDAGFGDLNNDGVTDMIVAMGANQSGSAPGNENLVFLGAVTTLNGRPFVTFGGAGALTLPSIATADSCFSTFVEMRNSDSDPQAEYILIGNSAGCDQVLLTASSDTSYVQVPLPTGGPCHNGILTDVDVDSDIDVVMACGTSNAARFSSLRFFNGQRVNLNIGSDVFPLYSSPEDPNLSAGDIYQSTTVDLSGILTLETLCNPSSPVEVVWDTFLDFGGTPGALDGHVSAVAVGDLSGDGVPDLFFASGTKSGSPAVDSAYVQLIPGFDYCLGQ